MTTATFTDRPAWKILMFAAFAGVFAYLLDRNIGLNPGVFADEWYYSKMARLTPLADAIVPSYLYLWVFRGTNACGPAFYDCVQAGNVLFFMAGASFVYLIARHFTGKAVSLAVALMSALAPINIYTASFMPESMYYFGFCVLSWVALTRTHWPWAGHALAIGAVLGLLSLVKVHALFLLPALCLFLLYTQWMRGGAWLGQGLAAMAVAALAALAVKFAVGYALAGETALSLLGHFYGGAASAAPNRSVLALLPPAFINARGHLMALAMLLPLPLALLAQAVLRPAPRAEAGKLELLQLFALLTLGSMAGITIAYTASIADLGVNDEAVRLHLRYYSFVFPLLWIVAAAALAMPARPLAPALRWIVALLLASLLALALAKLPTYWHNPIDGPEINALNPDQFWGRLVIGLDLVVLVLWALGKRLAAPFFLFAAMPAMLAGGAAMSTAYLAKLRVPGEPQNEAAALVRRVVAPAERGQLTIAGSNVQHMMRAQFRIDEKDSELLKLDAYAPIEAYQLPPRHKWLVVLGEHPLPEGIKPFVQGDGFTLVRLDTAYRRVGEASFAGPLGDALVARAEGLSGAEPWGRWSDAKQVVIHFRQPLPRHLLVIVKAQAYGINASQPFTLNVGSKSATFRLGADEPRDVALRFKTDGTATKLVIDVPQPVAPSERGRPKDNRLLGIGISKIEIGDLGNTDIANN